MPKDIVILCDGTGNEIGANISNVLKLFRVADKDGRQRIYYHPGLGTIGLQNSWGRFKQEARGLFGLAFGAGLDKDTLDAYQFLCRLWEPGDRVWMFGFSRGAYTVRVLAAFVHVMGLLPVDQLDLAGYAFGTYKKASADAQKSDGTFDYASPYAQLLTRGFRTPADLWFDMFEDPRGKLFFDLAHARGPTRLQPDLDDNAKKAVSLPTLLDALAPKDFLSFASPKALQHGTMAGFGILEGQPHNNVHRCIGGISSPPYGGGFMQANLSPVDPIFWLHHANIDRIWDVWERKQKGQNLPSLPDGAPAEPGDKPLPGSDYAQWAGEPFLFFTDAHGAPARKTTCGDYAEIGEFNYDYEPGSGDEVVSMAAAPASPRQSKDRHGTCMHGTNLTDPCLCSKTIRYELSGRPSMMVDRTAVTGSSLERR